jgi:uncharacterized protein
MKKTLIIGASTNLDRYSNKAFYALTKAGHPIELFGNKSGELEGQLIKTTWEDLDLTDVDTVTMYVGPKNQADLVQAILVLNPMRVIFNPGTENPEFYKQLTAHDIFYEEACTLVLLSMKAY